MPKSVLGSAVSRLLALCKGCRVGRVRLAVEDGEVVLRVEDAVLGSPPSSAWRRRASRERCRSADSTSGTLRRRLSGCLTPREQN